MLKILIADDENKEREMLEEVVKSSFGEEVELQSAENGRVAVLKATLWHADILLMDIEMPGLNGIEASHQILSQCPGVKIIFITAYSLFSYAHEAVRLGASDYILKPVEKEAVIASIRKAQGQLETERQLVEAAREETFEEGEIDKGSVLIMRVKKYLQHNYMNYEVSLDSVSAMLNISSSYLSVLFKKCTGINFIDYIQELKIKEAKELLKDPLRSANEIASLVGYESASYFTRAFKKKTGLTPSEWRKKNTRLEDYL